MNAEIRNQFKKGDMRRTWFVLGAVASLNKATLTTIVDATGMPKASVNDVLNKIADGQIPGVKLVKNGALYSVEKWGEIVKENGVKTFFLSCAVGLSDL